MRKSFLKRYDEIKDGRILDELEEKIHNNTANKEEVRKYRVLRRVEKNMYKIDTILDIQDDLDLKAIKLEHEIDDLYDEKEELEKREKELDDSLVEDSKQNEKIIELKAQAIKESEDLEKELVELKKSETEVDNKLKQDLSAEEKAIALREKVDVQSKLRSNSRKFADVQAKIGRFNGWDANPIRPNQENVNQEKEKIAKRKDEVSKELVVKENQYNDVRNKSARCDLLVSNLLKGRRWDEVEKSLDGFKDRKFEITDTNKRLSEKVVKTDKSKTAVNNDKDNKGIIDNPSDKDIAEIEAGLNKEAARLTKEAKSSNQKEKEVKEEAEKESDELPAVKKEKGIGAFFRKIKDTLAKIFIKEEKTKTETVDAPAEPEKATPVVDKNRDILAEELVKSDKDRFREVLKYAVENGIDDAADKVEADKEEKWAKFKEEANKRTAERYEEDSQKKQEYHDKDAR